MARINLCYDLAKAAKASDEKKKHELRRFQLMDPYKRKMDRKSWMPEPQASTGPSLSCSLAGKNGCWLCDKGAGVEDGSQQLP